MQRRVSFYCLGTGFGKRVKFWKIRDALACKESTRGRLCLRNCRGGVPDGGRFPLHNEVMIPGKSWHRQGSCWGQHSMSRQRQGQWPSPGA